MNDIRPHFRDNVAAQLKTVYFATLNRNSIEGAKVIFLLCVAYEIDPRFMLPEHLQAIQKEMRG